MTIRNDFPDFGQAPTFLTYNPEVENIVNSGDEIARFDCASYQYGVLYVSNGGTVVDNALAFEWLGAVGAEATVVMTNTFVRLDNGTIVIPFQVLTPTLRLRDVGSTTYPYNLRVALTLFTGPIYQHGFPGGINAINTSISIGSGATETLMPSACGPGAHSFWIGTTSVDYDVTLTVYPDQLQSIEYPLTAGANGTQVYLGYLLPATQWTLDITDNDGGNDYVIAVYRTPNPN